VAYRKQFVFNVLDYGADNTGNSGTATTTTAAINSCIAAALSGSPGSKVCVYFPDGHYYINNPINCDANNVTLKGDGIGATIIETTANATIFSMGNDQAVGAATRALNEIFGMTLLYGVGSSVARTASIGILMNNCSRSTIHNIEMRGVGVGISMLGDNGWSRYSDLYIEGSSFAGNHTNSSRAGISSEPIGAGEKARAVSTGIIINNVAATGMYEASIKCVPGAGDWIFDSIQGYGTEATSACLWFDRDTAGYSDYMAASNIKFDGAGTAAVYLLTQNRGSITNVVAGGGITYTVYMNNCTNMAVAGIGLSSGGETNSVFLAGTSSLAPSISGAERITVLDNTAIKTFDFWGATRVATIQHIGSNYADPTQRDCLDILNRDVASLIRFYAGNAYRVAVTPRGLAVYNLVSYANNAAALAGGLQVGDLYVITGSDPRAVAVVI
jgi:Pectate lyase superfamily protein